MMIEASILYSVAQHTLKKKLNHNHVDTKLPSNCNENMIELRNFKNNYKYALSTTPMSLTTIQATTKSLR